jgi:hypothetical protein
MNVRIRINGNTVVVSNTALKSATVDLRQQRLDDSAIQSLRRMLATEIGDAALRYSEKKVLEEVSKRVATRRWTQISLDPTPLLGHSGGGEAAKPVAPPPSQNKGGSSGANAKDGSGTGSGGATGSGATPPAKEPDLTWIEIQIVDEDGKPLLGETYEFTKTDGAVAKGSTTAAALRAEQIPPGKCKLKLPDLHKNGWTAPGKTR